MPKKDIVKHYKEDNKARKKELTTINKRAAQLATKENRKGLTITEINEYSKLVDKRKFLTAATKVQTKTIAAATKAVSGKRGKEKEAAEKKIIISFTTAEKKQKVKDNNYRIKERNQEKERQTKPVKVTPADFVIQLEPTPFYMIGDLWEELGSNAPAAPFTIDATELNNAARILNKEGKIKAEPLSKNIYKGSYKDIMLMQSLIINLMGRIADYYKSIGQNYEDLVSEGTQIINNETNEIKSFNFILRVPQ